MKDIYGVIPPDEELEELRDLYLNNAIVYNLVNTFMGFIADGYCTLDQLNKAVTIVTNVIRLKGHE